MTDGSKAAHNKPPVLIVEEASWTPGVSADQVALVPRCAECEAQWLPADAERWQAHLGADALDEPPEVVFYCPECAERA